MKKEELPKLPFQIQKELGQKQENMPNNVLHGLPIKQIVEDKEYAQAFKEPANEHRRTELANKAKKETRTTASGDKIDVLVAEDGTVLEYTNKTAVAKLKQQNIKKEMERKQEQIEIDRLSKN